MSDNTQKTNGKSSTKLYQALSRLSRIELSRLEKYLASPYLNPNEKVSTIIDQIQKVKGENWKTKIWGKLDNSAYDDRKFRKWMSDALGVLEDFLAFEEFKADRIARDQFLIRALEKRDLEKLQNKIIKAADKWLERQPFRNAEYHLQRFNLAKSLYELEKVEQQRATKRTDFQERLKTILNHLELFYNGEKLRLYNSLLSWSRLLKFEIDSQKMLSFVRGVDKLDLAKEEIIETYISVFYTLTEGDKPDHFQRLLSNIERDIQIFPPKEAKVVFDSALNYCLLQVNSGNTTYLNQLFDLYELGIKNQILIQDNTISPWSFKNIVTTALRIKKFNWAKGFVNQYAGYLPHEYRDSISGLTNALISFWTGSWNDVLFHLQKVQFEEASLKLNAELILISTYYELDEDALLEDAIVKTRKYLKRQKNIGATRSAFTERFLHYLKRISRPLSQEQIKELRMKIEKEQLASKTWLLEKVDELLS
jgi:hypothetical protein